MTKKPRRKAREWEAILCASCKQLTGLVFSDLGLGNTSCCNGAFRHVDVREILPRGKRRG